MTQAALTPPLRASLYELCLNSDDPAQLAAFYTSALGYRFADANGSRLGRALDRRLVIQQGTPRSLAYAAYAVPDRSEISSLEARLIRANVAHRLIDMDGFEPGALAFNDPDGNVRQAILRPGYSTSCLPAATSRECWRFSQRRSALS
jgi:catechol 2,3-dioxygenase